MGNPEKSSAEVQPIEEILGYLNFSSGTPDPRFLANLNQIWPPASEEPDPPPGWKGVTERLRQELHSLSSHAAAFANADQAHQILELVTAHVLPGYLAYHEELLFHQSEDDICNPFFLGRLFEAVLQQGPPWSETDRVLQGSLSLLNDFIGYRPVAVLESKKIEPYPRERIRPIPLYVRDSGVVAGPYAEVVDLALTLLKNTEEGLLRSAHFDPELLDELSFDPRAYDFDHPANKRPNYHFGLWDPHHVDRQGRFRRFVIQQVTLDALMQRIEDNDGLPHAEMVFEAAAVLAGTVLMASGISGSGPDTHDSSTTLATLLPWIAKYRDDFYEQLLEATGPEHAERLHAEALERRQPFGVARQHLNAQLARRRASQLEHVQLARLFACLGYATEAQEQAAIVPAASARMRCQIDCRLTACRQALDARNTEQAAELLAEVVQLLHRGIECGAFVDPWNILGFDAQFSLFPALENSVHDHRVDELIELVELIFGMYSRSWSEAAARDQGKLCERLSIEFKELANWWRQFAAHEVANADAADAQEVYQAAQHVASALNLWHKGGAAAGDIGFWAPHAQMFDSPQAYALVIEALFEQSDYVATRGLLVHWLSESDRVGLEQGESSFFRLAQRWLIEVRQSGTCKSDTAEDGSPATVSVDQWHRIHKFLDFMEANAESYWSAPRFELGSDGASMTATDSLESPDDGDEEDIFGAAYEDVVFRDSADDGISGPIFDGSDTTEDELAQESDRLSQRLAFQSMLSSLWRLAALSPIGASLDETEASDAAKVERIAALRRWIEHAEQNQQSLLQLLDAVHAYHIPVPLGDHDSMLEYDRRRVVKESLLERIMAACVEMADAMRLMSAAELAENPATWETRLESDEEQPLVIAAVASMLRGDTDALCEVTTLLIEALADKALLYVPLTKGGQPREIVTVRARQRCIQDLLKSLPRMGLLIETCRLIETARDMERNNPVGPGAVTEFDELFKIGFKALVKCLVVSAESWQQQPGDVPTDSQMLLVNRLEQLTESLLMSWLAHSRTLRLSVLEKVNDRRAWKRLVNFIQRYGGELFTQRFLNIGNVRAILHQGVDAWLGQVAEQCHPDIELRLLDDLDSELPRNEAVECLTLVLESIIENYGEYRDYNSTTTQSDRGELLDSLLDFLRLRAKYDRVCWNLKPVVMAHQILVRRGHKQAAQIWRRALRSRINEESDNFEKRLADLQKKYAMQMPSIADRIGERFMRPMVIDRVCALVEPSAKEAIQSGPKPTFRILQYEVEFLTRQPTGVGFDVPAWLVALEEEVQRTRQPRHERDDFDDLSMVVETISLTAEEIEEQIAEWSGR